MKRQMRGVGVDGWMDGQLDGKTDGWMDGWMNILLQLLNLIFKTLVSDK